MGAGLPQDRQTTCLAVVGQDILVGTYSRGIFRSSDNGAIWAEASAGLPGSPAYPKVDCLVVSGPSVFAACGQVFRSTDGGRSWSAANSGLPADSHVTDLAASGSMLFASIGDKGVFMSTDNGASWTTTGPGMPPGTSIWALAANDTCLLACTLEEVWRLPLSGASPGGGPGPAASGGAGDAALFKSYVENGDRAYRSGDFANAIVFFSKAIELDPKSVYAWFERAWSYLKLGGKASYDRALEDTTKVLELEPGNKDVYWVRGEIYLNLANFSLDKKNAKEAEDYANKAIADLQIAPETNPKSREIALRLGDARLAKGDLEGALADYAKMLEKDPHDWDKVIIPHLDRLFETCDKLGRDCDCGSYKDTWYLAGKFQDRKKHFDRAIKCYFKAIELGLTDSSVYWSRAVDYNFIGEWDKALSDANTIIKLDPSSYAYKFRADIYQRKGALDKAIDDYHKADKALRGEIKKTEYSEEAAQAVDKEAYEIHLGAAEAYLKKQNWSKAIDEYQAAIEFTVNPGLRRAFVLYRIGMAYQSKGDTKNAQRYFQQAEAMDPNVKK